MVTVASTFRDRRGCGVADCGRALTSGVASAQFVAAIEHSPIGTALVGLDGRWRWTNGAIRTILGYSREAFDGLDVQRMTHPDDLAADLEQVAKLIAGEGSDYQLEKRYLRKDGSVVWCLAAVVLIRDENGAPDYFVSTVQDISERKASALERAALIERLELATKSSGVGVWEWDLATDRLIWNAQMFELTGISPEVKPEYGMFIGLIDANHRERVDSILRQTISGTAVSDTEFPLKPVGGDVCQLRATATLVRDSSGEPVRMIGTN